MVRSAATGQQVRDDFKASLESVSSFSTRSAVSHRLWKGIHAMTIISSGSRLRARQTLSATDDPHSTVVAATAGLAGHRIDKMANFGSIMGAVGDVPRSGL